MLMINFSEPLHLAIALIVFLLVLWLARESKKSVLVGMMLFVFITILIGHTVQFTLGNNITAEQSSTIIRCIIFDLIFILLSFISYLWVDDIEAKFRKKKSIDNSLDWFWSKV